MSSIHHLMHLSSVYVHSSIYVSVYVSSSRSTSVDIWSICLFIDVCMDVYVPVHECIRSCYIPYSPVLRGRLNVGPNSYTLLSTLSPYRIEKEIEM